MIFFSIILGSCVCIHIRVFEHPLVGEILWDCTGLRIDDCCRIYLWSRWYPFDESSPVDSAWNVIALLRPVEAYLEGGSETLSESAIDVTPLGCVDTRVRMPSRNHIRFTVSRYFYPCRPGQSMYFWQTPASFDRTVTLTKGECGPQRRRKWRDHLRRYEQKCLHSIASGLHKFVKLSASIAANIRVDESSKVVPLIHPLSGHRTEQSFKQSPGGPHLNDEESILVSQLTLLDLNATDPKRSMAMDSKKSELFFPDPVPGHIYLGCAYGRNDIDVILELSFI